MCLKSWSCSVSEGSSFISSLIITHELGHSLGMEHDGIGINKKCDQNKFIMSPVTGPGKTKWSLCSQQNLKNFIASGNPQPNQKDPTSVPKCLYAQRNSRETKQYVFRSKQKPGQKYNAKQQCSLACGSSCWPVTKGLFKVGISVFNEANKIFIRFRFSAKKR